MPDAARFPVGVSEVLAKLSGLEKAAAGAKFLLGSDGNGMDVLSRVIHGTRYGFGLALPAGAVMVMLGVPLGLLAGYRGGLVDEVLVRVLDTLRAFPTMILALALVIPLAIFATVTWFIGGREHFMHGRKDEHLTKNLDEILKSD